VFQNENPSPENALLETDPIRIEKIRLKQLNNFAADVLKKPAFKKVAPITLARALSQAKNPYAHPEDVVLLVAYQGKDCVGYHGLLPGRLELNGQFSKVFWATAFFVSPEIRGKGVGKRLLSEIKELNIDFAVTGMTRGAKETYKRMHFQPLGSLSYYQLRVEKFQVFAPLFRSICAFLEKQNPEAKQRLSMINRWEARLYWLIKTYFYKIALRGFSAAETCAEYAEVNQINQRHSNAPASLSKPSGYAAFCRGTETVNWMISYPWVFSSGKIRTEVDNYYFSTRRDIFKYVALEIFSPDKRSFKGYLILSISCKKSKTVVKILDARLRNPEDRRIAAFLGLKYGAEYLADRIDIPEEFATGFKSRTLSAHLLKRQTRLFMFCPKQTNSPLAISKGRIVLNYCDGDTAFT